MNLDDIRTTARVLLGTLDTTNTWKDSVLNVLINTAQRSIWHKVLGYNPDLCATEGRVTYPANALSLDLETALSANMERLMAVYALDENADPSSTNQTHPLGPVSLEEIDSPKWGGNLDYAVYASSVTPSAQFRFAMSGRSIILRPFPTTDTYLWVRYTAVPADMSCATDPVFGGELPGLHDLVLYHVLRLCAARSKEAASQYSSLEVEAWKDALPLLESQSFMPLAPRNVSSR